MSGKRQGQRALSPIPEGAAEDAAEAAEASGAPAKPRRGRASKASAAAGKGKAERPAAKTKAATDVALDAIPSGPVSSTLFLHHLTRVACHLLSPAQHILSRAHCSCGYSQLWPETPFFYHLILSMLGCRWRGHYSRTWQCASAVQPRSCSSWASSRSPPAAARTALCSVSPTPCACRRPRLMPGHSSAPRVAECST